MRNDGRDFQSHYDAPETALNPSLPKFPIPNNQSDTNGAPAQQYPPWTQPQHNSTGVGKSQEPEQIPGFRPSYVGDQQPDPAQGPYHVDEDGMEEGLPMLPRTGSASRRGRTSDHELASNDAFRQMQRSTSPSWDNPPAQSAHNSSFHPTPMPTPSQPEFIPPPEPSPQGSSIHMNPDNTYPPPSTDAPTREERANMGHFRIPQIPSQPPIG
ncbi:hypothetical protein FRC02_007902 [Tulasnella sp. 418]|nr:hypothetical protein FRC02_007902 [Tulasnella sp. 418]